MKILFILLLSFNLISYSQESNFPPIKKGDYKSYISKDSISFKVDDKIEIGLPYGGNQFIFITQGNEPAAAFLSGKTVKITKLKAIGNEETGYKMYALFKGYGLLPVYIDIEQALKVGEIVTN